MYELNPSENVFKSHIDGIPCLIEVTEYVDSPADIHADSDWDFYGNVSFSFNVLDRKGKPAKWLERKLTDDINRQLLSEYLKHISESIS